MDHEKKGKMMVYLQTYEEANCTMVNECKFSYTKNVPTITGIQKEWDSFNLKWNLKVQAKDISGTPGGTHFYVRGSENMQETQTLSSSEAIVRIVDAESHELDGMVMYWEVGLGLGNQVLSSAKIILEPKLVEVQPKQGSAGGTLITLEVQGVGKLTNGL